MDAPRRAVVAGGGPAGFFAAIACAEAHPDAHVVLLEQSPQFLSKVRISGGGRCNVTHACFDPRELSTRYPRGGQTLIGPFHRFQPSDTVAWFAARGVSLKTEHDGRVFPTSDSAMTIVDCLLRAAQSAGVQLRSHCALEQATRNPGGGFTLALSSGGLLTCHRLLLATGGCRGASAGRIALSLGHHLEPPVPSLFAFHVKTAWLQSLAGISLASVEVSVPGTRLRESGPLLVTHEGLSGPVILRLSAWGARDLHDQNYRFPLHVNWLPHLNIETTTQQLAGLQRTYPARKIANTPLSPLPSRLWEQLLQQAGVPPQTQLAQLSRLAQQRLIQCLLGTQLAVTGKSLNQEEFVTCGGIPLREVNFHTLESRICPGLHFAGELLDIDGLTGGFNFQAAWTTGWLAGQAMA